jgi:hypothetical protein
MAETSSGADAERKGGRRGGMPRWVVVSLWVGAAVVLLAVVAIMFNIGGPHGPGRHSGFVGPAELGPAPASSVADVPAA